MEATEWVRQNGRFPKASILNKEECSLYDWLRINLPKARSFLPERWEKLNKAFGEGWQFEFSASLRQKM